MKILKCLIELKIIGGTIIWLCYEEAIYDKNSKFNFFFLGFEILIYILTHLSHSGDMRVSRFFKLNSVTSYWSSN